ncbi:SNF1 protein kinase subunit beta-3 [Escovopsis weberi]|uniref:SNF1 protein kinase subunit beta-3 n=1 Tax=Escovopsis weberi TaxID=150374 RepID=A0A0M9VTQ1_ESCWE|nr:SNF1 protein kinase subunit beta-3 [Escovopsis weberi]
MGNTHSASNRAGRPASPQQPPPPPHSHPPHQPHPPGDDHDDRDHDDNAAAAPTSSTASDSAPGQAHPELSTTTTTTASSSSSASASSSSARQHRRDTAARHHPSSIIPIIPIHTAHRAPAPPEPSLAQAQGSTAASVVLVAGAIAARLPPPPPAAVASAAAAAASVTLPSTAVSSLSGSPHSSSGNDNNNNYNYNTYSSYYSYRHGTNTNTSNSIDNSVQSTAATTPARRFSESRPPTSTSTSSSSAAAAAARDAPSKPVDVPTEAPPLRPFLDLSAHPHLAHHQHHHQHHPEPVFMATNSYSDMYINRPPRLPLPIEEEVHTPGSPIIGPDETFDLGESADGITRKSSTLSTCTLDDDEGEELRVDKTRPVVPTRLEWRGGGDKVYVTGTIFQWNRKHRLHPVEGQPGVFSATIYILPGTHHVRFLVDGIMQTSPHLPTTVDFGNNLVNYIEVNPDDARREKSPVLGLPKSAAAAAADYDDDDAIPASSSSRAQAHQAHHREHQHQHHQHHHQQHQHSQHQHSQQHHQHHQHQHSQHHQHQHSQHQHSQQHHQHHQHQHQHQQSRSLLRGKPCPPVDSFRHEIPQYLLDFDQPEESPAYRHAVGAIEKLPTPPSLPGFLGKPILNAATLMKDDNSVLNMPNHTILNHLATSSIKNNVLAVSATTRYHNKYVTTIIYKPTSSDEG